MDEGHTWGNGIGITQRLINLCRLMTSISCSSDFALYLEDYLVDGGHSCDNGSMRHIG